MFGIFRGQSRSASGAILYVTIGALMVIWSGLWYYYFLRPQDNPPAWQSFACIGTILSGSTIALIGLLFGMIGRGAKAADTTVAIAPSNPAVSVIPSGIPSNGLAGASLVTSDQPIPVANVGTISH